MTTTGPYPHPLSQSPAPRRSHTADVIVTSLLITAHVAVCVATGFFSLFYAMASDPCGSGTACRLDNITTAYVLTDLVGLGVLIVATVVAIVMMTRSRIAFWVPLLGALTQVALVAASFHLLGNVVP